MKRYALAITKLAAQDLDDLYSEGFTTWAEAQADRYFDGLLARFDRICEEPLMYRAVPEIREGYRRSVFEKHSIYSVVLENSVEIRAVVKRQDIAQRP